MIDLHCHVLPGVDDGPAEREQSLALLRMQAAMGVRTVAATSHVDHGHPANDSTRLRAATEELQADAAQLGVTLIPGAEVALVRALELGDDELARLRLGDSPWLLLEAPLSASASSAMVEEALFRLRARGHRLLLAHPERCPVFLRDVDLLARCVEQGMTTSFTASSFTGRFGSTVQKFCQAALERRLVHTVASDAHGTGARRPPGMRAELVQAGVGDHAVQLTEEAPAALLAGTAIPEPPAVKARRRRFRRA